MEVKDKQFKFRVSSSEAAQIRNAAASAGYEDNLSAYLRRCVLESVNKENGNKRLVRLPQAAKRSFTHKLSFRMTDQEKELINRKLEETKLSGSDYIRRAALGQNIIILDSDVLKKLLHELMKVGANLNQLMILCHKGKVTHPNINEVIALLNDLLVEIRNLMSKVN